MTRIMALCVGLIFSAAANGADLFPVTQFTVRAQNGDRTLDSDPFGFFGLIQDFPDQNWTDETFVEFDLAAFDHVQKATLQFTIHSSPPGNNVLIARTFDISRYAGSGMPDSARLGQGTLVHTLFVEAQVSPNMGRVKQFSFDVTPQAASILAGGMPVIGFRMHNPKDITPGSDSVPHVSYLFDTAQMLIIVPEPPTAIVATVLLGFCVCWRLQCRTGKAEIEENKGLRSQNRYKV
jgi:hypothetical protein